MMGSLALLTPLAADTNAVLHTEDISIIHYRNEYLCNRGVTLGNMTDDSQYAQIFYEILENWKVEGGRDRCAGCPANWANRNDLGREVGDERTSFQHRPNYAYGSINPDIVITGQEPGPPSEPKRERNMLKAEFTDIKHEEIKTYEGDNHALRHAWPLFKKIKQSSLKPHFTQVMKCNTIRNNSSATDEARKQCAGIGDYKGYLYKEFTVLDPDYVVVFGKDGWETFRKVFSLNGDWSENFTVELRKGDSPSGLRELYCKELGFTVFPSPHPSSQGAWQVYKFLSYDFSPENSPYRNKTNHFFSVLADDILRRIEA